MFPIKGEPITMSVIQPNETGKSRCHLRREQLVQLDFRTTLTAEGSDGNESN